MPETSPTYIPGTCNIGPAEIAVRRQFGLIYSFVFIIGTAILITFPIQHIFRVLLFLPAIAATFGLFQAAFHFCAAYGFTGLYNVLLPFGKTETVNKQEFRLADRRKALIIVLYSLLVSSVATLIIYKV